MSSAVTPSTVVFYALAALVLASAVGVAFLRNILHAALALLGALAGMAGIYLFLGADFLGVAQLLIYVGGVLVMLLFAVLLTNRMGDVRMTNLSSGVGVGALLALVVGGGLVVLALGTPWPRTEVVAAPTTLRIGDAFLREYLFLFELASVILLVTLVGAVTIARRAVKGPEVHAPRP